MTTERTVALGSRLLSAQLPPAGRRARGGRALPIHRDGARSVRSVRKEAGMLRSEPPGLRRPRAGSSRIVMGGWSFRSCGSRASKLIIVFLIIQCLLAKMLLPTLPSMGSILHMVEFHLA